MPVSDRNQWWSLEKHRKRKNGWSQGEDEDIHRAHPQAASPCLWIRGNLELDNFTV